MLHELFEKLYREVADVGDALAERALALGAFPSPPKRSLL
jgi:DNA-binding ferritin-like protein